MECYNSDKIPVGKLSDYDRKTKLKFFDDSKLGVKGLLDVGIIKIPQMFINDQHKTHTNLVSPVSSEGVSIIDFKGMDKDTVLHNHLIKKWEKLARSGVLPDCQPWYSIECFECYD